jgi:DeoR family glycerol-3-phosphate regulon repressor
MADFSPRQLEIINFARQVGTVEVEDLARRYEVTPQTIRKDLNDLCERKILHRTHGGATISSGVENLSYEARRFVAADEKRAIGRAAAALIPNGSSLFINIGTTTEEVANALQGHEDLLVITNNLNVAAVLHREPKMEVIVAGGAVRRSDGGVIGSMAVDLIRQFKVDFAVIGASAIDEDGSLLDFDYREVRISQAIIENARNVILVADSSKVARTAPVRIAHLNQIDTFVTDQLPSEPLQAICRATGVTLIETMR